MSLLHGETDLALDSGFSISWEVTWGDLNSMNLSFGDCKVRNNNNYLLGLLCRSNEILCQMHSMRLRHKASDLGSVLCAALTPGEIGKGRNGLSDHFLL